MADRAKNQFQMSLVAGYLNHQLITCENTEASACGAAYLAGWATSFWPVLNTVVALDHHEPTLLPEICEKDCSSKLKQWQYAIKQAILSS